MNLVNFTMYNMNLIDKNNNKEIIKRIYQLKNRED